MFILALSGGGIRGLFTAVLLDRLNQVCPTFLSKVDLFAGTSTGGILALGLANEIPTDELISLYLDNAKTIFSSSLEHKLETVDGLIGSKYTNDGLRQALINIFGSIQIQDLKHDILTTSYNCDLNLPVNFTKSNPYLTLIDAALCTSAAPTFFPPYNGCIDGGITANNPSMAAVSWAISQGHKLEDVNILSIGTGVPPSKPLNPTPRWGDIQWIKDGGLINLLISGVSERTILDARNLLNNRFYHLDGVVDCAMDESSNLNEKLIKPAQALNLDDVIKWIEK
jgi:patatin-like phospholipase/acyl hydrolase